MPERPPLPDLDPDAIPLLDRFADVADPSLYRPLPDDWLLMLSDVVNSTAAIEAGRYRAVNLAGAATISAASNALNGALRLFTFGGDGAGFAVPADRAETARDALAKVAAWAERNLSLELRVGMVSVADIRKAGHDVRVALWEASDTVHYAMFDGGGMAWAGQQLKTGTIRFPAARDRDEPDLTGLSCQWGSVRAKQGKIASLIVRRAPGVSTAEFARIAESIIALLETGASFNPVPVQGPQARLRRDTLALQLKAAHRAGRPWRAAQVLASTLFAWAVFKAGIPLGGFEPIRYRREIASNTDYRKFDDGLLITADCSPTTISRLRETLAGRAKEGAIRYGLHLQDEALMTCVAPSVTASNHIHFVDGAGGGYAMAARQLAG